MFYLFVEKEFSSLSLNFYDLGLNLLHKWVECVMGMDVPESAVNSPMTLS